jgi:hypothetical protein
VPRQHCGGVPDVGDAVAVQHDGPVEQHVPGVVHRHDAAVLDDDAVVHGCPYAQLV